MVDYYMKTYVREAGLLVAACDKAVVGKTLKDKDVEVNVSTHFYKGKQVNADEIIAAVKGSFAGNFFGSNAVKLAIKMGVIDKSTVKEIAGVPHAQFIRMTI